MTKNISKLITYFSLLKETFKLKEKEGVNTRYVDVDIELPDDFKIHERWVGVKAGFSEQEFHEIEFYMRDIDTRIKSARDQLRYHKKRVNGSKYGE